MVVQIWFSFGSDLEGLGLKTRFGSTWFRFGLAGLNGGADGVQKRLRFG